jgi:hypothetical protein
MAPVEIVALKTSAISAAVNDALDAWRENPSIEI